MTRPGTPPTVGLHIKRLDGGPKQSIQIEIHLPDGCVVQADFSPGGFMLAITGRPITTERFEIFPAPPPNETAGEQVEQP